MSDPMTDPMRDQLKVQEQLETEGTVEFCTLQVGTMFLFKGNYFIRTGLNTALFLRMNISPIGPRITKSLDLLEAQINSTTRVTILEADLYADGNYVTSTDGKRGI